MKNIFWEADTPWLLAYNKSQEKGRNAEKRKQDFHKRNRKKNLAAYRNTALYIAPSGAVRSSVNHPDYWKRRDSKIDRQMAKGEIRDFERKDHDFEREDRDCKPEQHFVSNKEEYDFIEVLISWPDEEWVNIPVPVSKVSKVLEALAG